MATSYAAAAADPHTLTILKVPKAVRNSLGLAKVFEVRDGKLEKVDYSAGKYFEVVQKRCATIGEWAAFHQQMATIPYACVVRGEPIPGLNPTKAQRTLANFPEAPRCWLLVDFDKPDLPRGAEGAEHARRLMPPAFHQAPCFWQRSGSYGVEYEGRTSDPWRSRIRLGFMLDRPLDAPRIKRWLRHHQCDLAIYTPNQITYTADPVFRNGAIDPVQAAGEPRHGTLDLDDALVDTVLVPDEIFNWMPTVDGVAVTSRPATIDARMHEKLMQLADECDTLEGEGLHGSVARWAFDAYGLGMDEKEIIKKANETLERLGRDPKTSKPEAARLVVGAQTALANGRLTISDFLVPAKDFTVVTDPNDPSLSAQPLTPAQAQQQAATLINWWDRLKITPSTGAVKNSLDNAVIILANHSTFKDDTGACILAYDAFQDRAVWTAPPPWWRSRPEQSRPAIGDLGYPVADDDYIALAVWLGHLDPNSGPEGQPIHIGMQTAAQTISHVARYRTVNPAQAYLDKCAAEWDGKHRLANVLKDVCHSPTNPKLLAQWFPKWMMQGVARVYKPGSKCDAVLVFTGGQGARKSTFLRTLCPYPEWFLDAMPDLRDKDAMQILRGKMIVELSEMFSAKKDVDFLKGFITKQDDTYRKSYGVDDARRPRTVIFAGSSNDDDCLTDTGGRRWWMVAVPDADEVKKGHRIDLEVVKAERDQWWGEAVHLYRRGEEWWLDAESERETRKVALTHSAGMEMAHDVGMWLDTPADRGGPRNPDIVRVVDVWCGPLCHPLASFSAASGRDVGRIMSGIAGWIKIRFTPPTRQTITAYVRAGSRMALDYKARNDYFTTHQMTSAASADFTGETAA